MSPKKRSPRNAKNKHGRGIEVPVEIGKEYDLEITDSSPNGEGIGSIKGFSIFVPNAKPGSQVRVRIKSSNSMCADAEVVL